MYLVSRHTISSRVISFCSLMGLCLSLLVIGVQGQDASQPQITPPPAQTEQDEVINVNTNIVQTAVTVVDRQGRFVEGLQREQFELLIDGKPQPLSFFQAVSTGSADEERLQRLARGASTAASPVRAFDPGRTVIFFIDDLHLAPDSLSRVRKSVSRFIENEMRDGDQAVITSTSGQIGFLQQLTDNKTVLRYALARLKYRPPSISSAERPVISEFQALAVEEGKNRDLFEYFVTETVREMRDDETDQSARRVAGNIVTSRIRQIIAQSANNNRITLTTLTSLTRSAAALPGRKLVFFASDGFVLDRQTSDVSEKLRRVTDAAVRAGLVIYTLDTRGLFTDTAFSAESNLSAGTSVQTAMRVTPPGENAASQEPLRTLAYDTGGRPLLNTNDFDTGIRRALQETARYYLLAWQLDALPRAEQYRQIAVTIKGRPELSVLVQRGFLTASPATTRMATATPPRNTSTGKPSTLSRSDVQLMSALYSTREERALPVALLVGYMQGANADSLLTASLEVNGAQGATPNAADFVVDIALGVFDDTGKVATGFKQQLVIKSTDVPPSERRHLIYGQQLPIKPGLYQVRVSVRERNSGRLGTAMEWIEVPETKKRQFALSSIFIGENTASALVQATDAPDTSQLAVLNPDRRFNRASRLRFFLQIYNARRTANDTDVRLSAKILRGGQAVITTPEVKVITPSSAQTDETITLPFISQLPLAKLPAGRYRLIVTAVDRTAQATASQHIDFTVE